MAYSARNEATLKPGGKVSITAMAALLGKTQQTHLPKTCACGVRSDAEENGASRRAVCSSAEGRAELETGLERPAEHLSNGEEKRYKKEILNKKFPLVQMTEWPFQKLLQFSNLWVLGLKYEF